LSSIAALVVLIAQSWHRNEWNLRFYNLRFLDAKATAISHSVTLKFDIKIKSSKVY